MGTTEHFVNIPLAMGTAVSRSFWNDIGGLDCFAISKWMRGHVQHPSGDCCKARALTFRLTLDLVDPPNLIQFSREREENPKNIGARPDAF
jgi:hypothetical protein